MSTSQPSSSGSSPDTTPATSQLPAQSQTHRRRRRNRAYRPAKNSLFDVIRQNAGTSLFVRPICWTDLHAELLGARFEELPPCDTPLPVTLPGTPPSKGHMRPSQTIITLSEALTQILLPDAVHPILCSNSIKTILMTLWPESFSKPQYLPELHLFFGGRVYRDSVRAQIMWNYPTAVEEIKSSYSSFRTVTTRPADSFNHSTQQSTPQNPVNLPMVCYIGKSQLASIRRNLFRVAPSPGRGWNEPVWRLQQLRAKMLIPSNADHDAHFVGIFLAMAQKHFYAPPALSSRRDSPMSPDKKIPPCPNFQDITLRILTHDTETAEFLVYTGHITAKFLEKFHNPFKNPDDEEQTSGIKIEYTRVPIWPILGLRERLGKALGEEVVGQFNPEEVETWEVDREKHETGKRKREVLTEVFNNSFSSESEDEPSLTAKKRCLSEGTPSGVVN